MFQGRRAEYEQIEEVGQGVHGQAFKARVTRLVDNPDQSGAGGLVLGQTVLVKSAPQPRPDLPSEDRFNYLHRVNETLMREYSVHKYLAGVPSAAHILDMGTSDVALEVRHPIPTFFLVYDFIEGVPLNEWREANADRFTSRAGFLESARRLLLGLNELHKSNVLNL